jgi:competence protein ComEC
VRRRFDLLTSVFFAAFCILTAEPYQLFDAGFQLSFLAMTGISIVTKPLSSVTGEAIAASLAVQLSTVPAAVCSFNCFEPFALFINIPVILLASVLVPLCIVLLMLQIMCGFVPACGISLAEIISYAVIQTNHLLGVGTGSAIRTAGFGAALTVLYYLALFGFSSEWTRVLVLRRKKKEILKLAALALLPAIAMSSCLFDSIADDEVVFVSVGQGDCTHIRAAGRNILIDGGGDPGSGSEGGCSRTGGYNIGEKVLMPYLLHSGACSVDAALVTHLHADHYKGICELSEVIPVGVLGIPIDYRNDSDEVAGGHDPERILYIRPDTKLEISDDVYIEVLWPLTVSDKPLAADDPNEHNTVYMIHYGRVKIMVTGDLLEEDELEMIDHYEGTDCLRCDVLKVAHHGSKSSSSEAFLDAASPSVAVIQVGSHNFYGHPHQQTLDRLKERDIKVFRTDLNGAVGIDIRGNNICVDLFRK